MGIQAKKELGFGCYAEESIVRQLSDATDALYRCCEKMQQDLKQIPQSKMDMVNYYHEVITENMADMRLHADLLEQLTDKSYWPYPTYSDLLFY